MAVRTSYIVSALIGAILGEIIGYSAFALAVGLPFKYWISHPLFHTWALHGAVLGMGMRWLVLYIKQVTKR